ncbi:MAG: pyridoxine 5'-phosphate synthase [Bacteroidetes bacterium]|jgi:pyridoxine 5-phosphate synthase|nr:pyridoxine 5'-phosphate synthase [Bacteroidota bacterium]
MSAPILSVNINKFATIRNARGGNNPNLLQVAKDCESFGAQGITVHPRPDERHIRYADTIALCDVVSTEYNVEGNPTQAFIDLVLQAKPTQVTLVPDSPETLTSDAGWDCITQAAYLQKTISIFKEAGIRTAIFIDPVVDQIKAAKQTGTDRIELYTEAYARGFANDKNAAIAPYTLAAEEAEKQEIGLNAGHDLDLENLKFFKQELPNLLEVSIGHALVCDALYLGLHNTIVAYRNQLK